MQPQRHAEPLRERAQVHVQRSRAAQLQLSLALGKARLGERLDQRDQVLVRHQPPDRQHAHRARRRRGRRAPGARRRSTGSRSALWMLTSMRSRGDPQPLEPLDALGAEHDEAVHSRRQQPVHAALQAGQHRIAPGRQLAHDHQPAPVPAAPGQRAPGRRPVLRADDHVRARPGRSARAEAAREHQRACARRAGAARSAAPRCRSRRAPRTSPGAGPSPGWAPRPGR